jgi:putative membrane protein
MKQFNDDFKSKLYETIEDIENNSLVEIVAIFKSQSGKYQDISLWFGVALMFLAATFFMFSPIEFDVYLIYLMTFFSFIVAYFLAELIKPIKKTFLSHKRKNKNVDIYARAVFQKGGIRFTDDRIGVLVYVSMFERDVRIIADRGAESLVPDELWKQMDHNFNTIFKQGNVPDAFIKELKQTKHIFAEYILPVENDINELPDDLEVEI